MGDWLAGGEDKQLQTFEVIRQGLAERAEVYGVSAEDAAEVARLVDAAAAAQRTAFLPATRTPLTIAAKQRAFAEAKARIRRLAAFIRLNPNVSPTDLAALGLPPKPEPRRVPAPTATPMLEIRRNIPGGHEIDFAPLAAPGKGGKPADVYALELFVAYTPPGHWEEELCRDAVVEQGTLHSVLTRRVSRVIHPDDRLRSTAHYVGRWLNRRGEGGPFSHPVRMMLVMPRETA